MNSSKPTSIILSIASVLGVPKNAVAATRVTTRPVTCNRRPTQYTVHAIAVPPFIRAAIPCGRTIG